jgi:hypothetical protein
MGANEERWVLHPDSPHYLISDQGRVKSLTRVVKGKNYPVKGGILAGGINQAGYRFVGICTDGKQKPSYVHRAVLRAFVGEPRPGEEACHNNGDPSDNRLENLRWDIRKNNALDKINHGTMLRGETHKMTSLKEADVMAIRQDRRFSKQIASEYGIHFSTVCRIKQRKVWAHVP